MHSKSAPAKSAGTPETDGRTEDIHSEDIESEDGVSRRHALISIGKYTAYVAPAMTVLLRGSTALAGHKCDKPGQGAPHIPVFQHDDGFDPRRYRAGEPCVQR